MAHDLHRKDDIIVIVFYVKRRRQQPRIPCMPRRLYVFAKEVRCGNEAAQEHTDQSGILCHSSDVFMALFFLRVVAPFCLLLLSSVAPKPSKKKKTLVYVPLKIGSSLHAYTQFTTTNIYRSNIAIVFLEFRFESA